MIRLLRQSSSGRSSWGSSSGSSGRWSTYSRYGNGPPFTSPEFVVGLAAVVGAGFVLFMYVVGIWEAVVKRRRLRPPVVKAFVSRITVGIDWRARRALQSTLVKLAASGRTER